MLSITLVSLTDGNFHPVICIKKNKWMPLVLVLPYYISDRLGLFNDPEIKTKASSLDYYKTLWQNIPVQNFGYLYLVTRPVPALERLRVCDEQK